MRTAVTQCVAFGITLLSATFIALPLKLLASRPASVAALRSGRQNIAGEGGTVVGVFAPFCRPTFITRSELCGAMEAMEMESPARSSAMTTRSFDPSEIKILRCPYCGDESRATSGWVCSHMTFQCHACGEQVGLHETKIRKTFHAVRRKLGEITGG